MSVNRMKAARDVLESKKYVRVVHHIENGIETTPPTVIVRDIWAINHQLFSLQNEFEGVSNGDMVGGQDLTPPHHNLTPGGSPRDTKEEPNKNNQAKIKDSAPTKGAANRPRKTRTQPAKVRELDPLFDAVALHIFKVTDPEAKGGRIAKISTWLGAKNDAHGLGMISHPAEPKHIELFAAWCKANGYSPPCDVTKFVEKWRAWVQELRAAPHSLSQEAASMDALQKRKAAAAAEEQRLAQAARVGGAA